MERLTQKTKNGYKSKVSIDDVLARLGAYEDMHEALEAELTQTENKMTALRQAGKEKSATWRQLFAQKLTLQNLLTRVKLYINS